MLSAFWCALGTCKQRSNVDCDVDSFTFALLATVPCGTEQWRTGFACDLAMARHHLGPQPCTHKSTDKDRESRFRAGASSAWCAVGLAVCVRVLIGVFKSRANPVSNCYSQRRGHGRGHQLTMQ